MLKWIGEPTCGRETPEQSRRCFDWPGGANLTTSMPRTTHSSTASTTS